MAKSDDLYREFWKYTKQYMFTDIVKQFGSQVSKTIQLSARNKSFHVSHDIGNKMIYSHIWKELKENLK